jgi:PAS domain S-box-containing protein
VSNTHGVVKYVNEAAHRILGNLEHLSPHLSLSELSPEAWVHHSALIKGNLPQAEMTIAMGDRTVLLVQIPIKDGGEVVGVLNLFQDLSRVERIIGEIATYRQMIDDMVQIVESSYDGFFITDGHGTVLRVNSSWEKITGVSARDVIGRTVEELEQNGYFTKSATKMVLKERKPVTVQKRWFTGREVLVTANPIFDENDEITMVVSNVRDLSDIRRLTSDSIEAPRSQARYQNKIERLKYRFAEESQIIAESKAMADAFELAERVAGVDAPVLITGETGVGKEVIANFIHRRSPRSSTGPILKLNCGAIPENLLESELFGYEAGAFTGASEKGKAGLFESANGGTILLDEIGELPLNLQVKLLRVLQDFEITRIGGVEPKKINVRLISITNRDLKRMVTEGFFRQDLYFRINVVPIYIPPLRERTEDIVHLINLFLRKANLKYGKNALLSRGVIDYLVGYEWPGNVRELINLIEQLVVVTPHDEITMEDLPSHLRQDFLCYSMGQMGSLKKAVRQFEISILKKAIETHGSVQQAAYYLKVDPATIYRKLKTA